MYDFTIIMYTNFKFVDGFYMMIRFYDNNNIMILFDDLMIILYDDIWYNFNDATTWHIDIYYMMVLQDDILYDGFIWCWDVMRIRWWLRSTAGSYGWPVIEVAYGETMIHSTEAIWEILAREEWLGCHHDTSPMVDIPKSTLVWAPYMIFYDFHDIKSIYILCF